MPTRKVTPIFEQGQVVRVPFPYAERDTRQRRPALVVSAGAIGEAQGLLWVAMITSAGNRPWRGDIAVGDDHRRSGLPIASVVRPLKIATIDAARAEAIGQAAPEVVARVLDAIRAVLGFTP